jgi:hypothetical protein
VSYALLSPILSVLITNKVCVMHFSCSGPTHSRWLHCDYHGIQLLCGCPATHPGCKWGE